MLKRFGLLAALLPLAAAPALAHHPMEAMGLEPTGYGPDELARIQKADFDKWAPVIKASGFKPGR